MHALVAHLAILTTWLLLAIACVGWGAWYLRGCRRRGAALGLGDFFATFWMGVATLLGVLQLWHFVAAIDATCLVTLLAAGIVGFLVAIPSLLRALRQAPPRPLIFGALVLTGIAIFLANRATGPGADYDAGLYHIPAINWARTYAIVPGLGNLHIRFGFSSTLTLFSAWLDHFFWEGIANHFVNGFFILALAAMVIRSVAIVLRSTAANLPHWLLIFCGLMIFDWARDIQMSSYSTDVGSAVLAVIAAHYFLEAWSTGFSLSSEEGSLKAVLRTSGLLAITLAAAAITAKASTLILCAPLMLMTLYHQRKSGPLLLFTLFSSLFLLLPWMAREVILTGYPLYPAEIFPFPVDWKMPYDKVHWLRRIMLDWARWHSYQDSRNTNAWIDSWLHTRLFPVTMLWKCAIPAWLAATAALLALLRFRRPAPAPLALLACTILAAILWYRSAPDPRYASQLFVLMMGSALLLALAPPLSAQARRIALIAAGLLAIAPLVTPGFASQFYTARTIAGLWILPPSQGLFHPTPQGDCTAVESPAGIRIYIAVPAPGANGPGSVEDRVWNAPLPNCPVSEITPLEVTIPPLRLRDPAGNLQRGFMRTP